MTVYEFFGSLNDMAEGATTLGEVEARLSSMLEMVRLLHVCEQRCAQCGRPYAGRESAPGRKGDAFRLGARIWHARRSP